MADLFETPEKLPLEVQEIINKYEEVTTYEQCEEMLKELKPFGYKFSYYLDATPYNLRKTN